MSEYSLGLLLEVGVSRDIIGSIEEHYDDLNYCYDYTEEV